MSFLIKILRFIVSLILIPVCVAITISFYSAISNISSISTSGFIFILGALSYSLLHLLLFKLNFLYVLGHELMHAVATFLSKGKVLDIKVSNKKGSVKTTTPNFLVILAPYLIPGYTLFIGLLYFLLSFYIDITRFSNYFIFLIGFTMMFHLSYTSEAIKGKQSDLIKTGYLLSISFIYIVNLLIVSFILSLLFKDISFLDFISSSYEYSKNFYYLFWKQLFL